MKKRLTHPHPIMRIIRLVAGLVLLVAGLIGALLPVVQGWMFILPALALLAPESRHARRLIVWLRTRLRLRKRRRAFKRDGVGGGGGGARGTDAA